MGIDGEIDTYTWVTAPFSTGNPTIETFVTFSATTGVDRIRLLQENWSDWNTPAYAHNFNILYTTDPEPSLSGHWLRVTGVENGWEQTEFASFSDGGVDTSGWDVYREVQSLEEGWFSITFDAIVDSATALMFSWETVGYRYDHWAIFELEVYAAARPLTLTWDSVPENRYFLLSIPVAYDSAPSLAEALGDLGPMSPFRWRGFALRDGVYEENPELMPGGGYWIFTVASPHQLTVSGLELGAEVQTPLSAGWNLIGSPQGDGRFVVDNTRVLLDQEEVRLTEAVADSHLAGSIWWWEDETGDFDNGNGAFVDARIGTGTIGGNPWGGYLLYAAEPCTLVQVTERPLPALLNPMELFQEGCWSVFVMVGRGIRPGAAVLNAIEVGTHPEAEMRSDLVDVLEPPCPWQGPRLVITQPGPGWNRYRRAFAPPGHVRYAWDLELTSPHACEMLTWQIDENVPADFAVWLIDPESESAVDLRETQWHEVVLPAGLRRFQILIASKNPPGLPSPRGSFQPCLLATPNPTSGPLDILFEAPRAGLYRLDVLDVAGRVVETILQRPLDRGSHQIHWNGLRRSSGRGVYFLRLLSPDRTWTQRLLYSKCAF